MKLTIKCIAIVMAVTLLSCGRGSNFKSQNIELQDVVQNKKEEQPASLSADTTADRTSSSNKNILQSGNPASSPDWDKKIIKTANVTLELKDYQSYNGTIHNGIKRYGAYIAGEQQNESDSKIENSISIKVPADRFEDLMNSLPAEGVKVLEKKIGTEDVTGEVVDMKARTEARKQVREQYLGLLKKAKTMKDILEVQKEINSIQEDIESGSGRVEYLSHEAAYSTVNLTYFQYLNGNTNNDDASPAFITRLKEAFKDGTSIITGVLVMVITIWPLILGGLAVWLIVKKYTPRQVKVVKTKNETVG